MKVQASLGVLSDRRFAWYFAARTVSTAGSVMVPVSLAFAVLHIDESAGALAQVLGVRTLTMVVFLLVGGVIADRFSRIVVLQVSHVLTCLTQALASYLIISGDATLTQLTVIEGVNGAVSAFTMPAMMGIVPLVVDRTRLQEANALLSFSRSGLGIIGPAIAGLLVVGVGPGWALAVDALTYAGNLANLAAAMGRSDLPQAVQGAAQTLLSLGLGGALGTVALLVKQELLLPIVGGVFVLEALSVIIQVGSFKLTGKRVFKMAPLHHHFELAGWSKPKVITRFLIAAIVFALFSLTTLKLR